MEFSAEELATFLNGKIEGNPKVTVNSFSKIEEGKKGSLTFLANPKYEHYLYRTDASVVLINNDFIPSAAVGATLIRVPNAYTALASLMSMVEQTQQERRTGVHPSACIAASAQVGDGSFVGAMACVGEHAVIGRNCVIHPFACVGDHVCIGDGSAIYPHVTVYARCSVGQRCIIHAGAVIGADGFGFAPEDHAPEGQQYKKIPQIGNVVLEDEVEIGANTTVDRAVMGSTVIRRGVKLDNLIQIAHNVEIGEDTVMAAQTGIAGSTKVGKRCRFAGQVGIAGHLHIGDGTVIAAQSGVMRDLAPDATVMGTPAIAVKDFFRSTVVVHKLPDIYKTLNRLQQEVEELKSKVTPK
ncbi:MAG: UDP-3-O-(3-hydroxymyristoyl)glucosamine N-acyltransferase [Tannerella sp.]|jgi:UDP-3-O-[3-hydroxymyristoyl] glucosamine N-acyltransferase|nr:UDP-3-O-(3-hydroxymyristoyl)glucosamine N-acyltransferase [Tannerella sp.]